MTAISDSLIISSVTITTETLDLMAFLASVNPIFRGLAIVSLIALASAHGAHLLTAEGFSPHLLTEIPNQISFFERFIL
jgi:hypothetical protein